MLRLVVVQKLEEKRLKQRERASKYLRKRRKLFLRTKENDKDYGENCQKPDMTSLEYNQCKEEFLKNLPSAEEDRRQIEKSTILQRDSSEWLELRRKLLTASNFAKVVNRRQNTSVRNLVKNIIYPKNLSNVPSLKHGIEHEAIAAEQIASQLNIKIEPCGLFIDKKFPFLGATPDGIVGTDTIIEIKCPITAFKTSLDEAINNKKVLFWRKTKNGLVINKKHPWYIQVQGQLHITDRRKCIFGVWSGCDKDIKFEIIERDDQYWEQMEAKLENFYITCMLPELCDPRHVRNMPIRDLSELK
ncbi:unnamed protein product [Parnassius mnemosyne]|uniref:YqaJ viral recombinase domain-containing protein n=1 Tax=Parnassius mnemosyne TaxID=213953 RepID=A0AAV1LG68_9NEOP